MHFAKSLENIQGARTKTNLSPPTAFAFRASAPPHVFRLKLSEALAAVWFGGGALPSLHEALGQSPGLQKIKNK